MFKLISDEEIKDKFNNSSNADKENYADYIRQLGLHHQDAVNIARFGAQAQLASCEKEHEGWKSSQEVEEESSTEYFRGYEIGYENGKKDSVVDIEQIKREAKQAGIRKVVEWIEIHKLPEGLMPQSIGEMSFAHDVPISGHERRDEWRVKLPCGHTIVLVEPTHQVYETNEISSGGGNYGITVNPSIVCPHGDWHGFIIYSAMTAI